MQEYMNNKSDILIFKIIGYPTRTASPAKHVKYCCMIRIFHPYGCQMRLAHARWYQQKTRCATESTMPGRLTPLAEAVSNRAVDKICWRKSQWLSLLLWSDNSTDTTYLAEQGMKCSRPITVVKRLLIKPPNPSDTPLYAKGR
jgi:hypothetical protein